MKTVVTSANKSAGTKKPALTAAAKKASSLTKAAPQKASRSSSIASMEKPAPKTQSKQTKAQTKPAVSTTTNKAALKSAAKPASEEGKAGNKASSEIKETVTSQKKKMLPKEGKERVTDANLHSESAFVSDNKDSGNPGSGKNLSGNKAETGLKGRIAQPVVSKVSEVATNTMKSTPPAAGETSLLTEEQILKMSEEDYMNPAQLAFFKARLQQLEKDLLKNADETTEHLRETVLVPDPADRATIEEEHALELRTRDRERKLLKKVQQSLAAIESGDYGWCEETGEPIGVPRLLARPTATLSLEAQQRRELKQKLYGD